MSLRLQEICAVMTLQAPAGQAEDDVRRLTGLTMAASTLRREARLQGQPALALRAQQVQRAATPAGVAALAALTSSLPQRSTLVIEIDAWNIRERDD